MKISWTVLKLQSGHGFVLETATYKVQRGITQKVWIQGLWLLRFARRLMLVNIWLEYHEDILNCFQVTARTRFCDEQTDRQTTRAKTICLPTLKGGDIISLTSLAHYSTTVDYMSLSWNHCSLAQNSVILAPAVLLLFYVSKGSFCR